MSEDEERAKESGETPRPRKPARKPFLLRLSPELMGELRGWADSELRSLNAHIEYLLRESLKRRKGDEVARLQARVDYYEEAVCMKGNPLALPVDGTETETEAIQVERVAEVLAERDAARREAEEARERVEHLQGFVEKVLLKPVPPADGARRRDARPNPDWR